MKISVKVVFGVERPLEVLGSMTVLELKQLVNEKCRIPVERQKLLLSGRALVDTKTLAEYGIQEGAKITVFVAESSPAATPSEPNLHTSLYNKLRLFYSDEDALKVTDEFMADFHVRIASLSLDDIERMATQYLEEDRENVAASNNKPVQD